MLRPDPCSKTGDVWGSKAVAGCSEVSMIEPSHLDVDPSGAEFAWRLGVDVKLFGILLVMACDRNH